jgi:hypothetical protein
VTIDCEVLEVSTTGDKLRVVLRGIQERGAEWRRMGRQELLIDNTEPSRRAYRVGRRVSIAVIPR